MFIYRFFATNSNIMYFVPQKREERYFIIRHRRGGGGQGRFTNVILFCLFVRASALSFKRASRSLRESPRVS